MENQKKNISIYYDGQCNMCTVTMNSLQKSSQGAHFHTVDVTTGEHPEGVNPEEALRHMYVVDQNGQKYTGADGFIRILEEYPRWRWLVGVARLWGIRHMLRIAYFIVSTHRRRFNSLVR